MSWITSCQVARIMPLKKRARNDALLCLITLTILGHSLQAQAQGTLTCYDTNFLGYFVACNGTETDCSSLRADINNLAKRCHDENGAPPTLAEEVFSLVSVDSNINVFGVRNESIANPEEQCGFASTSLNYAVNFINPNVAASTACDAFTSTSLAISDTFTIAQCEEYVSVLQSALIRQSANPAQCLLDTTPTTTMKTTATSTGSTTHTSSLTSTAASTATTTGTSSASTSFTSTATTSASSTASTSVSSSETTSQSTSATSSASTSATSSASSSITSSATTTATTTKVTTEYRTPATPVVQCLFSTLTAEEDGTPYKIRQLSDTVKSRLGRSFLSIVAPSGSQLDGSISAVEVLRGVGEYRGSVVVRGHLANSSPQLIDSARSVTTTLNLLPFRITAAHDSDGRTLVATASSCSVANGRASADLMFRNWAHRKFDCPGEPPDLPYWVL